MRIWTRTASTTTRRIFFGPPPRSTRCISSNALSSTGVACKRIACAHRAPTRIPAFLSGGAATRQQEVHHWRSHATAQLPAALRRLDLSAATLLARAQEVDPPTDPTCGMRFGIRGSVLRLMSHVGRRLTWPIRVRLGLVVLAGMASMAMAISMLMFSTADALFVRQARADLQRHNDAVAHEIENLTDRAAASLLIARNAPAFERYFEADSDDP